MNKLLREEIKLFGITNIVKTEDFSKRMRQIMKKYRQNQIDNAESFDDFLQQQEENELDEIIDELV